MMVGQAPVTIKATAVGAGTVTFEGNSKRRYFAAISGGPFTLTIDGVDISLTGGEPFVISPAPVNAIDVTFVADVVTVLEG